MRRAPLTWAFGHSRGEQEIENQQRDPDVDRGVRDVEDEKMTAKRMQIEIVNDRSMRESIDGVAQGAADNQSKARRRQSGPGPEQPPS